MNQDVVLTSSEGHVGVVQLNRPETLNAVSFDMLGRLNPALEGFDADDGIHVIVVHGCDRAFAAGADITDMADSQTVAWYKTDPLAAWERIARIRKPMVAAVTGYALGGGCELAMMCDIVIAGESAKFGQPEVKIGLIPGAGGTQRLIRAVGKACAMDMILTGRVLSAGEALRAGLVSRVVPDERCLDEAMDLARELADNRSAFAIRVAKAAVLKAHESFLAQGLRDERDLFYLLCATEDHSEGIKAFIEKRPPRFTGR